MFNGAKINFFVLAGLTPLFAQVIKVKVTQEETSAGISPFWYVLLIILAVALFAVIFEVIKKRKTEKKNNSNYRKARKLETQNSSSIDADSEIEWFKQLTKAKKVKKSRKQRTKYSARFVQTNTFQINKTRSVKADIPESIGVEVDSVLPIFEIKEIETARPLIPLPISDDEMLLNAIEQVDEEFESDEEIRSLSLRVLVAFKTQNSVEAISQIALYDLSTKLRSEAISILSGFDHEMVFETLLLACADPTREIRAAAAAGIFRLSVERKDAWLRIIETNDIGRIRQSARALISSDLLKSSIERLTHQDKNYAAEALAMVSLLIKAGETDQIFEILKNYPDEKLKKAILHVIEISDEPETVEKLISMDEQNEFNKEISDAVKKIQKVHNRTFQMAVN